MTRALLVCLLLVAASCNAISSPRDDRLYGNWRGPTAQAVAYQSILYVYQDTAGARTDGAISVVGGLFEARGSWMPRATPGRPDRTAELRRVQITGWLQGTSGILFITVTDSANGERYLRERLDHVPPPPPPSAPPVSH